MQEVDEEEVLEFLNKYFTDHNKIWWYAYRMGWGPYGEPSDSFDSDWGFDGIYNTSTGLADHYNKRAWSKDSEGKIIVYKDGKVHV